MLPKHYQYQYDSENLPWASVALFLPVVVTFTPPLNQKGPPLGWKIWKIVGLLILIAQNKGLMHWMQRKNPQFSAKYHFWKNQEKPGKNGHFWPIWQFLTILASLSSFFMNGTLQRGGVFCVAFSLSKPLFRAIKINNLTFFLIFHPKGGPFWFRGDKILPTWLTMVEIWKLKQFWNQCDKWNNLVACVLGCSIPNTWTDFG